MNLGVCVAAPGNNCAGRQIETDVAIEIAIGRIARIAGFSRSRLVDCDSGSRAKAAGPAEVKQGA